ncbi:MAG: Tfp pilus assembly protein FimT/FimU [Chthoniobacteraceae bacterium]
MPIPPPISASAQAPSRHNVRGFSLLELMAVISIFVVLMGLSISALTHNRTANITNAGYQIANALELARGYAVANHTYTWVGIFEEDSSKASASPATSGIGRLVISAVASRDGTAIFNEAAAETTGTATPALQTLTSSRLVQISKLVKIENVHVCTPKAVTPTFAKRPGAAIADKDRVGLSPASTPLLFQFQYPLGGTAQYTFGIRPTPTATSGQSAPSGIVMFNPQGEATSDAGPQPGVAPCKEIAIQASHGTKPDQGTNVAAVGINGLTGLATLYRP